MNTATDYHQQAIDFLQATGTEFKATFLKHGKHFADDKQTLDIYEIELKRGNRSYKFDFGQSINSSGEYQVAEHLRNKLWCEQTTGGEYALTAKEFKALGYLYDRTSILKNPNFSAPDSYDVLTSLTKYDPGTFENFCDEFGYDTGSRKAEKTYKAVLNEWHNVAMLFTDAEIEQLQEIQ